MRNGGRVPATRSSLVVLVVALVAGVAASAVAGAYGIERVDEELRRVTARDIERLVQVTHVRRLFRSDVVLAGELATRTEPGRRAELTQRRGELRRERGGRLARLSALQVPGSEGDLDDLMAFHARVDSGEAPATLPWEEAIARVLERIEWDLEASAARAAEAGRRARIILLWVSTVAVAVGLGLGLLVLRHLTAAARLIRTHAERLRAIVEAAPSLLVVVDARGQLRYLPQRSPRFLGWTAEALMEDPLCWVIPAERPGLRAWLDGRMGEDAAPPAPFELIAKREDDSEWYASISASALENDAAGDVTLLQILDVTPARQAEEQRRKLEEQLQRAQRLESAGRIAGGLAHDFNNVLTVVSGAASLLQADAPPTSTTAALADELMLAAEHGSKVTRQLLAFAGSRSVEPRSIDVAATVEGVRPLLTAAVGQGVQIVLTVPPGLGRCRIDTTQLTQAILNLTLNAAHAMGQRGTVAITLDRVELDAAALAHQPKVTPGWFLEVTVADTGCGIAPEIRHRIFDPFFTTKGSDQGSGLGLAMVDGIVTGHGGFVEVDSVVDVGTSVRLYFPAPPDHVVAPSGGEP